MAHLLPLWAAAAIPSRAVVSTPALRHCALQMKRRDDGGTYYQHLVGEGRDWARPRRRKRRGDEPRTGSATPATATSSDELDLDVRQLLPYLGQEMGSSAELMRICAKASGHDHDTCSELQAAGGHRTRATGVISWANASILVVNVADGRAPVWRRRNMFWREEDALLFSWFPDRGQALENPAVTCLLDPEWPVLLFCRLDRDWPFVFAGRLSPVALSLAEGDGQERPRGQLARSELPVWSTPRSGPSAADDHVVWRLVDAEDRAVRAALFEGASSLVSLAEATTGRPVHCYMRP